MSRWKRDVIYSLAIIVFCAVHWVIADGFVQDVISLHIAQPSTYAHLILGLMALLAVAQLVRALRQRPDEQLPPIWSWLAVTTVVSLVLYVATIKILGFLLSTTLLMSVLVACYAAGMGKVDFKKDKKKAILTILACIAIGFVIAIITQIIFKDIFGAKLPKCKLF